MLPIPSPNIQQRQAPVETTTVESKVLSIDTAISKLFCGQCHKKQTDLKICGRCKYVHYCSIECQRAAWEVHKLACFNKPLIPDDHVVVCQFKDGNEIRVMTQGEFKNTFNKTFVTGPLFPKTEWCQIDHLASERAKSKEIESDLIALQYEGAASGYGVVALKKIKKDQIICNFGGIAVPSIIRDKELLSLASRTYSADGSTYTFDPTEYTSLGSFVNDGPPNCQLDTRVNPNVASNTHSVPFDKVLVATREINPGEIIYAGYGYVHAIKLALYHLDKDCLSDLIKRFGGVSPKPLDGTGSIQDVLKDNIKEGFDVKTHLEIEYIFGTPLVLALLHLKTDLNPLETLNNFITLTNAIPNIRVNLTNVNLILKGIYKIKNEDKSSFSEIINEMSQYSLIRLCELIGMLETPPAITDCKAFGQALDKLRIKCLGTLCGAFWGSMEQQDFKKQFLSKGHIQSILDEEEIKDLPLPFQEEYNSEMGAYLRYIFDNHLSPEEKKRFFG